MRILTVSHTAGSPKHGMLFRPFYLSREFVRQGHEASIVSASYFHTRYRNPEVSRDLEEERLDGVRFIWLKTLRYAGSGAVRAFGILLFAAKVCLYARHLAGRVRPDVVIATSPDPLIVFGAWAIARFANARFVFEIRDIWPLTLVEVGGMSRWHPFILLLAVAERFAVARADLVVSVLARAHQHLREIGRAPRRFAVIPNGVSVDDWRGARQETALGRELAALRSQGYFTLGYAGYHGTATALMPLIESAGRLRDERIALVLVGDGPDKPVLKARADALGVGNVRFFDPVPKEQLVGTLALFDACYVASPPARLYEFGVSFNKIFDYMMAERPIVSAIRSEADPVALAGCGIVARGPEARDIADAIRAMAGLSSLERAELGRRGKAFVLREHEYTLLAARYLEQLTTLTRA